MSCVLFALFLSSLQALDPRAALLSSAALGSWMVFRAGRKALPLSIPLAVLFVVLSSSLVWRGTVSLGFPEEQVTAIHVRVDQDSVPGSWGARRSSCELLECFEKGGAAATAKGMVSVSWSGGERLLAGDRVIFTGSFTGYGFRAKSVRVVERAPAGRGRALESLGGMINTSGSTEDNLSLMLLLGYSDSSDFPLTEVARESGTSHVLALSGMHTGLLTMFISFILSPILGKRGAKLVSLSALALFVAIIGPKASVIRACLLPAAFFVMKRPRPINALLLSFVVQAVFFPTTVLSLASTYSYLSLSGIMGLSKPLSDALDRIVVLPGFLSSWLTTGVAAALFTAPVSLMVFGEYQLSGILVSGPAGILVYLHMAASVLPLPGDVTKWTCMALGKVMEAGAAFPMAETILPWLLMALSVMGVFGLSWTIRRRKSACGT